jgi:hypothetical protein
MTEAVMVPKQLRNGMFIFPYESGNHEGRCFLITGIQHGRSVTIVYFLNTITNSGPWTDLRVYLPSDLVKVSPPFGFVTEEACV